MAQSEGQKPVDGDLRLEEQREIVENLIEDNYVILNAFKANMQQFKVGKRPEYR